METHFNVKAITKLTGLNEHTLRAWERRYGAVSPQRQGNGRRIYSHAEVERLRLLVQLQNQGHGIGQIAALPDEELRTIILGHESMSNSHRDELHERISDEYVRTELRQIVNRIEAALCKFDLLVVHEELTLARHRFGAQIFCLDVVSKLTRIIGRMVFEGRFSISQEHAFSAIIRAQLGSLVYSLSDSPKNAGDGKQDAFAITTMEGDLHEIGIMIAAVLSVVHGFKVYYLGPNLPPESLAEAARAVGAQRIILGKCVLPHGTLARTPEDYLQILGKHLPEDFEIWLGGAFDIDQAKIRIKQKVRMIPTLDQLDRDISQTRRLMLDSH